MRATVQMTIQTAPYQGLLIFFMSRPAPGLSAQNVGTLFRPSRNQSTIPAAGRDGQHDVVTGVGLVV